MNCKWKKMESAICTFFFSGYALDPSLDNHQVSTKYIGSVEEAEKIQEALNKPFKVGDIVKVIYPYTDQVVTKAKKSIANFKLREGMPIGCKVTLRKEKMYEFLDKLFNISLPRVRDFRGVSDTSFDGRGNYTLGIKEQIIFPEIDFDKVDRTRGMDIVIVTSAKTNEEAKALLTQMGMPFKKQEELLNGKEIND